MPYSRFNKLPDKRQSAILDAAATEFSTNGYDGASFNRIIEKAGISKGSMYYYFEDKKDLYVSVLARMSARYFNYLGNFELDADAETFWQQAEKITALSMEYYAEDPTAAGLMRSLLMGDVSEESHTAVKQMRVALEAWWQHLLRVGQKCGAIRDDLPNQLMIGLMMAICDVTDLWCVEHIEQLSREDMRQIAYMLVNNLHRIGTPEAADESCLHIWERFQDE